LITGQFLPKKSRKILFSKKREREREREREKKKKE
jgi:hypothetical protein